MISTSSSIPESGVTPLYEIVHYLDPKKLGDYLRDRVKMEKKGCENYGHILWEENKRKIRKVIARGKCF